METTLVLILFLGILFGGLLVLVRRVTADAERRFAETSTSVSPMIRKRRALQAFWGIFGTPAILTMTATGWKVGELGFAAFMFVLSLAISGVLYMPYAKAIKDAARRAEQRVDQGVKPVLGNWE